MRGFVVSIALGAVLTSGFVAGTVRTAGAANVMQFARIQYDSPGTDNRSNASLNAEYVQLKNTGHSTVNLKNWTVRDSQNHVYKFTTTFSLAAGRTVTLHTGHGTNTATNRYWNSSNYIWNNSGDRATLKTPSGATADSCSWSSDGAGYKNC